MKLKGEHWALIALALLALTAGGVVIYNRKQIEDAFWVAFDAAGFPGEWGIALARQESNSSMRAVNLTGGDLARGGAWGPTQITEKTARAYGYSGPMEALTTDLPTAVWLTMLIVNDGAPRTLEDLGAWWNAGRRTMAALPADHVTRTNYIPHLKSIYERIA